jgi:hypothetical protein
MITGFLFPVFTTLLRVCALLTVTGRTGRRLFLKQFPGGIFITISMSGCAGGRVFTAGLQDFAGLTGFGTPHPCNNICLGVLHGKKMVREC